VCAALLALASTAHDAWACDAARKSAARGPQHGRAPLIIGDSTMIFAAPYLGGRGLQADAHGCRQFAEGVRMLALRRRAGTLPRLSILALGANGAVSASMIEGALRIVGPDRLLGLAVPRNLPASQAAMRRVARRYPSRVLLIDWAVFSRGHDSWFGGDGLHVNDTGARAFAAFVARRAAPLLPPAKPLRVPRTKRHAKACGRIHRGSLRVFVPRGARRITCARARQIARRPPLVATRGWRSYDWRAAGSGGPWREIYARADRRVLVGTVR
jgi:hypothetical protein